jgi:cytochrome b pre-mRNA-processing protein 3
MLRFLFPALTPDPVGGAALFDAVTSKAREPHWYVEGEVPDTLDGRFRMLATIAALVAVRLESEGDSGEALSVAFTERFIEVMESEHRELGLGDPTLGKTVRKRVGSLARRAESWRSAAGGQSDWNDAARKSVYKGDVAELPLMHTAEALRSFWSSLLASDLPGLAKGQLE